MMSLLFCSVEAFHSGSIDMPKVLSRYGHNFELDSFLGYEEAIIKTPRKMVLDNGDVIEYIDFGPVIAVSSDTSIGESLQFMSTQRKPIKFVNFALIGDFFDLSKEYEREKPSLYAYC
tara:strand:+ start:237 stop:590 length:354 start_codon:yes stop_codon:yes gene_type:complete